MATNSFLHRNEKNSPKQRTVDQRETVQNWQRPFPQIKPFPNGTVASPSVDAKQALTEFRQIILA